MSAGLILDPTFHSKFYVFKLQSGNIEAIVDSSNLTSYGFQGNIETNIKIINASKFDADYNKYFGSAEQDRAKIRKQLENYRKANEDIMDLFEQIVNTPATQNLLNSFVYS